LDTMNQFILLAFEEEGAVLDTDPVAVFAGEVKQKVVKRSLTHTYTHLHSHTHPYTHTSKQIHTHTCTHTQTHTSTHTHTSSHNTRQVRSAWGAQLLETSSMAAHYVGQHQARFVHYYARAEGDARTASAELCRMHLKV